MMPDLPNMGMERDVNGFMVIFFFILPNCTLHILNPHKQKKEFFENPAFRTDGLKIYPTLVIRGTGTHNTSIYNPKQLILFNYLLYIQAFMNCGRPAATRTITPTPWWTW